MNDKQVLSEFLAAYAAAQPRDDGPYDTDAAIEAATLIPAVIAFLRTQPAEQYEMALEGNGGEVSITVRIGRAEPVEYVTKQDMFDMVVEMARAITGARTTANIGGGLTARSGTLMRQLETEMSTSVTTTDLRDALKGMAEGIAKARSQ
jgi:nucleoside diphosphate kinase